MEVKINSKEIAEAIAAKVEQVTGLDCEVFAYQDGAVIVHDHTKVIALIAPMLFGVVDVTPVGGVFEGESVEIPTKARTVNGIQEIAHAMDEANVRVISAAVKH